MNEGLKNVNIGGADATKEFSYELALLSQTDAEEINYVGATKGFSLKPSKLVEQLVQENLSAGDVIWKKYTNSFFMTFCRDITEGSEKLSDSAQLIIIELKNHDRLIDEGITGTVMSLIFDQFEHLSIGFELKPEAYGDAAYNLYELSIQNNIFNLSDDARSKFRQSSIALVDQSVSVTELNDWVANIISEGRANLFSGGAGSKTLITLTQTVLSSFTSNISTISYHASANPIFANGEQTAAGTIAIIAYGDHANYWTKYKLNNFSGEELADAQEIVANVLAQSSSEVASREAPHNLEIMLWGDTNSGKTVYISQLYLNLGHSFNTEEHSLRSRRDSEEAEEYFAKRQTDMLELNTFPSATSLGLETELSFAFEDLVLKKKWNLSIFDRAGEDLVSTNSGVADFFIRSSGILLFLNAINQESLFARVKTTIEELRSEFPSDEYRKIPVAVCFTKFDAHVNSLQEFEHAKREPASFVKKKLRDKQVLTYIYDTFDIVSVYPISSVGLKIGQNNIDKAVFYDNNFNGRLRIKDDVHKLNLLEPLKWILSQEPNSKKGTKL